MKAPAWLNCSILLLASLLIVSGCSNKKTIRCRGNLSSAINGIQVVERNAALGFEVNPTPWPLRKPGDNGFVVVSYTSAPFARNTYQGTGFLQLTGASSDSGFLAVSEDKYWDRMLTYNAISGSVHYTDDKNATSFSGLCRPNS